MNSFLLRLETATLFADDCSHASRLHCLAPSLFLVPFFTVNARQSQTELSQTLPSENPGNTSLSLPHERLTRTSTLSRTQLVSRKTERNRERAATQMQTQSKTQASWTVHSPAF